MLTKKKKKKKKKVVFPNNIFAYCWKQKLSKIQSLVQQDLKVRCDRFIPGPELLPQHVSEEAWNPAQSQKMRSGKSDML